MTVVIFAAASAERLGMNRTENHEMSDEADLGNEAMERWLEAQISEHQYQLSQAGNDWPYGLGRCKNCGGVTEPSVPFCSADCREDFDHRLRMDRMNRKYRGG